MRRLLITVAALLTATVASAGAQGHARHAALKWGPAPEGLPPGGRVAVVSGDPTQEGPFVIRLAMPAGYKVKPHMHPTDEDVKVLRGTLLVGMGESWNPGTMKPFTVGKTGSIPANSAHSARARGRTVIEISSTGPFGITYVNPADDPRKAATP